MGPHPFFGKFSLEILNQNQNQSYTKTRRWVMWRKRKHKNKTDSPLENLELNRKKKTHNYGLSSVLCFLLTKGPDRI